MIDVASVQQFHGHLCPGLALGIRVAEQALLEMGERPGDEEVVAVVETDNCAVDAIQFITGCTFGKGNLIHLDYGKNAFRFFRRRDGKAIRIRVRPEVMNPPQGAPTGSEAELRQQRIERILSAPLGEVVEVRTIDLEIPSRARVFNSVMCARCGEKTMETRLRLLNGQAYCPECFQKILQSK